MRKLSPAFLFLVAGFALSQEATTRPPIEITGLKVKTQLDFDGTTRRPLYQEIVPCRLVDTRTSPNLPAAKVLADPYGGPSFINESRSYSVSGVGRTNPCSLTNRQSADGDAKAIPSDLVGVAISVSIINQEASPVAGTFAIDKGSIADVWFGWPGMANGAPTVQDAIVMTSDVIKISVNSAKADVLVDLLGYFVDDPTAGGPMGPQGDQGIVGKTGQAGAQGLQGLIGLSGTTGDQGVPGPQGLNGPTGPVGPIGTIGPPGAQGQSGLKGDKGDQGPIGPIGPNGPPGAQGSPGPKGDQGPIGPIGPNGPPGTQGAPGPKGDQGPIGPNGPPGAQGAPGPKGDIGQIGPQGPPGPAGPIGTTGSVGPQGASGAVGPKGDTGPQGPPGLNGSNASSCDLLDKLKGCLERSRGNGNGEIGFGPFRECVEALLCSVTVTERKVAK